MVTKLYWQQSKVYFFAQASYFSKRLLNSVIKIKELRNYFPDGFDDYIKVEPINDELVKIVSVNNVKFVTEFVDYLNDFYYGQLSTSKNVKPEQYSNLLVKLLKAIKRKFDQYGYSPIIELCDIWPDQDGEVGLTPFWELIFAEMQVGAQIEILNIGYEGAYLTDMNQSSSLPFVEISILPSTLLHKAIEPPKLRKADPATFNTRVEFKNNSFYIIRGNQEKKLKTIRESGQYYHFARYLGEHPDTDILLDDIVENVEGCKAANDLTELVRLSGFNKVEKKYFFKLMKKKRIHFTPNTNLTHIQFDAIINRE